MSPVPGEQAPSAPTATVDDDLGLTSASAPSSRAVRDARAQPRRGPQHRAPRRAAVATPAFCQSVVCGPSVATVDGIRQQGDWGDTIFLHSEIYAEQPEDLANATLTEAVDDLPAPQRALLLRHRRRGHDPGPPRRPDRPPDRRGAPARDHGLAPSDGGGRRRRAGGFRPTSGLARRSPRCEARAMPRSAENAVSSAATTSTRRDEDPGPAHHHAEREALGEALDHDARAARRARAPRPRAQARPDDREVDEGLLVRAVHGAQSAGSARSRQRSCSSRRCTSAAIASRSRAILTSYCG